MSHAAAPAALILAAGQGRRLGRGGGPKILLPFGNCSLLERHLSALAANGISDVALTVGYAAGSIREEAARLGHAIAFVDNSRFREGSVISLAVQAPLLRSDRTVLVMDGDVLYDARMIARLLQADGENILLVDRQIEPGDEPVKICFRDGRIVDFRKKPEHAHDWHGESVGFFRFSPEMAAKLADRCESYLANGQSNVEYEEAIRDLILAESARFAAADISDLPWTEIDFEGDVDRAERDILPRLSA